MIYKDIEGHHIMKQSNLTVHSQQQNTYSSQVPTFLRIDHIVGYEIVFNKLRMITS